MRYKKLRYYLFTFLGLLTIAALAFLLKTYHHGFFKKTATGLQYQMIRQGKGPKPHAGDVLLLDVSCKTEKGVVLFSTADEELPLAMPYFENIDPKDGSLAEAVKMLQKGDHIMCKLSAEELFSENMDAMAAQYGVKKNTKLFLHLQLQDIMTEAVYKQWETNKIAMLQKIQQEKAEQQFKEDAETIANYLKENQITAQTTASGLCYVIDTPGQGAQPKQGNKVKVNYTGRLLDGTVFDTNLVAVAEQHGVYNPRRTYEAFAFQVGLGQVIQGWDEGIMCLHQGDKGRLFIPSTLAYGSRGSGGDGLIPANAILIFEVELVAIQD
jgi:FKBP-type peptidyl-prolyl cis-trans isomerase FkpA